jgi:hypothetical protein
MAANRCAPWWIAAALVFGASALVGCGDDTAAEVDVGGEAGADGSAGPGFDAGGAHDGSSGDATVQDDGGGSDATVQDANSDATADGATADDGGGDASADAGEAGSSDAAALDGALDSSANGDAGGDSGAIVSCGVFGATCAYGSQCCSGRCDPTANTCASSIAACSGTGTPCAFNTDCCNGSCVAGVCGGTQCLSIGATCPVAGNQCCTGNCANGQCAAIASSPTCTTAGNACTSSPQCCSGLCKNNVCALASSYCIQTGDMCFHANDCCGGLCNAPNGQAVTATNPGVCSQPQSGSVNCTGVDGSICPGGNCGSCCSRLCAPFGPSGVNICQPATGCRVEGDLCRKNTDCCGAAGSGVLGDGSVVCSNSVNGGLVGVCMTPGPTSAGGTCVPEGDVCHYTASNYTCGVSSARADCCGPQNPKFLACVLDPFGVPRCNAYTGPQNDGGVGCIAAGSACAMASDCCGGVPCVPNASGQLVCGATACQSAGASCTVNADCCSGLPCIAPPGSIQGTCTSILPPPPPPPTDAGTTDSGVDAGGTVDAGGDAAIVDAGSDSGISPDGGYTCALYGQSCASLPCCAGTSCISGKCITF